MTPILLMADYGADPVWERLPDGKAGPMISIDSLPLSDGLKGRVRAWADRFDNITDTGCEFPSAAEEGAWAAEGRVLLELLRRELGPGFQVERA